MYVYGMCTYIKYLYRTCKCNNLVTLLNPASNALQFFTIQQSKTLFI